MKYYKNGGFYDKEIHGLTLAGGDAGQIEECWAAFIADAVEITEEHWLELLNGQSSGKLIQPDENGYPVLVDPPDNTEEVRQALALKSAKAKLDELQRVAAVRAIPLEDDETALAVAPACPDWLAGTHYEACDIVNHNGQAYKVIQAVDALENQPPDAEGMLAVYRPLVPEHAGTLEDPIPFADGMDVYNGKYYTYNEETYLAKADMLPCTWPPGTEGVWQWEKQSDGVSEQ